MVLFACLPLKFQHELSFNLQSITPPLTDFSIFRHGTIPWSIYVIASPALTFPSPAHSKLVDINCLSAIRSRFRTALRKAVQNVSQSLRDISPLGFTEEDCLVLSIISTPNPPR